MYPRKHRIRVAVLLAVVALGAIVMLWSRRERGHLGVPPGSVVASGTVEMTEVQVSPKIGGRLAWIGVDEGAAVRPGQRLARLDALELDARVAEAAAALRAAEARLRDLEAGTRPEEVARAGAALQRAQAAHRGALDAREVAASAFRASTELKQQVDAAEAALLAATAQRARAEARLRLLRTGARPEEVEQARAALAAARARQALVREGPRQEELDEGRAALAGARAALANAEATHSRLERLFAEGAVSRQQLDDAAAARERAQAALEAAQARVRALTTGSRPQERQQADAEVRRLEAQLRLLEAGFRPEEVQEAQAEVRRARATEEGARQALRNAQRLFAERFQARGQMEAASAQAEVTARQVEEAQAQLALLEAGPTAEALRAARAARDQARALLSQARARRQEADIFSPIAGVVAERVAETGETVAAGQPILTLLDRRDVWVRVYVPVTQLGRIGVGTHSAVRVDGFPGREFAGRVTEVSQIPEFTPKNVQTQEQRTQLVYWAKVSVADRRQELKPGLPADAIFRLGGRTGGR